MHISLIKFLLLSVLCRTPPPRPALSCLVPSNSLHSHSLLLISLSLDTPTEEVILAEERTTEEEKLHIMEGIYI